MRRGAEIKTVSVYKEITEGFAEALYKNHGTVYISDPYGRKVKLIPIHELLSIPTSIDSDKALQVALKSYEYGCNYKGKYYIRKQVQMNKVKNLKKGCLFMKEPCEYPANSSEMWVRGDYIRSKKKYEIYKFLDVNHTSLVSGDREIFVCCVF